jgi:N-acetylneuraminic acid mutarotase
VKKKCVMPFAFSHRRVIFTLLLCTTAACSMLSGTLLDVFRSEVPAKVANRTLTFAERVAYQREIEEIYWRHRIWPKERADAKPSLDAVMSQAQLEEKVADYLRESQALEDHWQRPITSEDLQAEMDRMANHTKQPEILRELFTVLGSDPLVIAECLARPVLSEYLTAHFSVQEKSRRFKSVQINGLQTASFATTARHAGYKLPIISDGDPPCVDDTWTPTSTTNAGLGRIYFSAVWTGTEMIVWGGAYSYYTVNTGERYNPATDSWTETTTANAPQARAGHTAVWTGSEMIIWGGGSVLDGGYLNTGGRYDPITNSWTATSIGNAPAARLSHTAVWTGSEMIVWGGYNGNELNDGGRYNPSMDRWTATNAANTPDTRYGHTAVWTGNEMIVWGGYFWNGTAHWLDTGGRYNPSTDSWTATSITNAPTGRRFHTAVWTGGEMIVWGGFDGNIDVNTGGRYDPSADTWTATSTTNAPSARDDHTVVWTNSEMIVWSGCGNCNYSSAGRYAAPDGPAVTPTPSEPPATPTPTPTASPSPGTGGRYNPTTDSWRATSTPPNAPAPRFGHTAVWTGSEMIIWGGAGPGYNLNDGGRYCAAAPAPSSTPTASPTATPTATATATATASPTPTPTPTPCTGRCSPTPRPRPTPAPRP